MTIDLLPWDALLDSGRLDWSQGEHVTLIGPTGLGKTTLARALLLLRERAGGHVCVVGTKPRDSGLDVLRRRGYRRVSDLSRRRSRERLILLWPPLERPSDRPAQREAIEAALDEMFNAGGWCVYVDELRYLTDSLRLAEWLNMYWLMARSNHVSLVASTQRPRFVPLEAYSQATHLFIWGTSDRQDLDRLSGLGTADTDTVRRAVVSLPTKHHCAYVNTRTGDVAVTKAPKG